MSTKMSTDMNISRPSSRVTRAPGGGSSIVFGDAYSKPAEPKKPEVVVSVAVVATVPVVAAAPVIAKEFNGKVGVVVAGSVGNEQLRDAVIKALTIEGITGCVVSMVGEVGVLPYAAQNLAKNVDVVVAAAIVINDTNGSITQSLNSALLHLGITGGKAIIPALVNQSSLLEAKAVLPGLATSWAKSVGSVLGIEDVEVVDAVHPVIPVKPVLTAETQSPHDLLVIFRESIKAHGATGICGIGRKFRIADDDNSGQIDFQEFSKVVQEHALGWSAGQVKSLFDLFDKDKSGQIDFDEFIQGLRGELNDRRKQLVLMAFEIMDADKSGCIDLDDIKAKYSGKKHPDVISGKRTEDEVLREFMDTFDGGNKDGKITPDEFIEYYGNVSASIDDDDYFELMIRNAWHISGGSGWCENSSCRRVLVNHKDGHQTVEEIKNDLGINADDIEALTAKLVAQGITDIESIESSSGSKSKIVVANDSTAKTTSAAPAVANGATPAAGTKGVPGSEYVSRPGTASAALNPRRQPGGASTFTLG